VEGRRWTPEGCGLGGPAGVLSPRTWLTRSFADVAWYMWTIQVFSCSSFSFQFFFSPTNGVTFILPLVHVTILISICIWFYITSV
jgi:hypothetical protein